MLSKLRVVAFDLDNTLWDVGPVIERAEARLLGWLEQNCPRIPQRVSLEDMRAARLRLAEREPHRAHDFTYLRITALAQHAQDCGYEREVAERAFEIFFAARNEIEPFADVLPALSRLRSRYVLATLSNGNADLHLIPIYAGGRDLGDTLDDNQAVHMKLGELFTVSLNARDVGAAKPHRRGFDRLVESLRLEPQEILYVGDDPYHDVVGAREAGLAAAWMNRRSDRWPVEAGAAPDIVVSDCTQLASMLLRRPPN